MTDHPRPIPDLMTERMALVARISELNARHLRLCQVAGGTEIDLARHARDAADPETEADAAAAADDMARGEAARRDLDDCERRIAETEAEIDLIDREIAAAANMKG
ncbi:hypothetical protein LNKW23_23350 [Paralimibaculum aggregatum]|uniref:Uncharacterized protein n=1 Tax=Paralimibaculum aggregatum TaxID=3036245 RepID=A0ABQ6LN33_9RHOB|nr:hypothetical protein [Limibaculum sp. NKW23]GMG83122.1 hypothetical protein LNKW23_23350 [Limibaculum sp. NKW23]